MDTSTTTKPASRRLFSIANLLILTTIVAVHSAFPALLGVFGKTCFVALLATFLVGPIVLFAALFSKSKNGQLDISNNHFVTWTWRICIFVLVTFYYFNAAFVILTKIVRGLEN